MLIRAVTVHRPAGYVHREYDDGRVFEFDLLQCIHCQYTWRVERGSGRERGWCTRCGGVVCGAGPCMTACVHFERRLDLAARGLIR